MRVTQRQYEQLLRFRTSLRGFLRWSESQARAVGLTPAQHQLMLAIKGHPGGDPTVGDLADHLFLKHHSAVELLDRAVAAGFVERWPDNEDGRVVRTGLTPAGEERLEQLTDLTLRELKRLAPVLDAFATDEDRETGTRGADPRQS